MAGNETELRTPTMAGDSAQPTPRPHISVAIPGITLGKQLGEGGMAAVYEGFDQGFSPPRQVAIKFMDAAISADPEFRKRFGREAHVVASFRHDNIVHVHGSGEVEGTKYIVMEYLSGGSLAQRLRAGALSVTDALRTGIALADALAYSHARDIIHRDFKPGNVLLTAEGKPVLSDFGVAKSLTSDESMLTRHAVVVGAPRYMSPEQASADAVTPSTDIYSLGLTLFEMLTGTLPPMNLRVQRDPEQAADLLPHAPDAPPRVVNLISRCLQFAPTARPTAAECRDEIRAALADLERPPAPPPAAPRNSVLPIVGGIAIAVLIAVLVYMQFLRQPAPATQGAAAQPQLSVQRNPPTTRIYLDDAEIAGNTADMAPGLHTLVGVAPGYYGEVRHFRQGDAPARTELFNLQPVALPSASEYALFLELDDAVTLSESDVERISEKSLQTALRAQLLWQSGQQQAVDQLQADLQALSKHGDARSPVAMLLTQSMRTGKLSNSLITSDLRAAADGGDAMASFFLALAQRSTLSESAELTPSNPVYRDYCDRLAKAAAQGWQAVAQPQRQMDRCPN